MKTRRVFVDTGAWFAIQAVDDEHHDEASNTLRALLASPSQLVTTNHIIGETYTLLRVTRGYAAAARFLESLEETSRLERVLVGNEVERAAFALLARYQDHGFSFVDGVSFAFMRARRLRYAFAFDSHFATAGFLRVPMDCPVEAIG